MFSFIVNLVYAFQDHDYLYLVMDFLSGGNLRYHLSHKKRFNEEQTSIQLYIYNIISYRIFCSLYIIRFRIYSQTESITQRYQTRKFSIRFKWLCAYN